MIKTILFDLDGTITDPAEGITNSVAYALNKYGITVSDKSKLNSFIGPPLAESFMKYYGFSDDESKKAVNVYREYFSDKGIFENKMYDGIIEMLEALSQSGKNIILATSKPEVFAEKILEHFEIRKYFSFISGSLLDGTRVDKHEVIEHALLSSNITDRSTCIMVGDRMHDIVGAKKSSLISIGVEYGYGSKEELITSGADYTVTSVCELLTLLQNI